MREWPILGGVRFFLAAVVMCSHLYSFSQHSWVRAVDQLCALTAVIGFLIISGYSIAHSVKREPHGYLGRRAVRILPLYFLAVALSFAVGCVPGYSDWPNAVANPAPNIEGTLKALFFGQLFWASPLPNNRVVWTLAIEAVFYLAAPALLRLPRPAMLTCVIVSALAFVLYERSGGLFYSRLGFGANIVLFAWAWIIGFWYFLGERTAMDRLALLAIPFATLALSDNVFLKPVWPFTLLVVLVAIIVGNKVALPTKGAHWLTRIGDISYPMYLINMPAFLFLSGAAGIANSLLLTALVLAMAWGLDVYFDGPLKRALRRERAKQSTPELEVQDVTIVSASDPAASLSLPRY